MKIFLKILGFIFASMIAVIFAAIVFILGNSNINNAIWLLSERTYETYVSVILCLGLGILFAFCPIMFEINKAIEDKFY